MGDRSGGREPKGASLKKSKKNPGSKVAKAKTQPQSESAGSIISPPPPMLAQTGTYFDSGCSLLSRQFDRDRERVLSRGAQEGVGGILIWSSDVEKQEAILDICKLYRGQCYGLTGIVPDNINRTNKKMQAGWLSKLEECGRQPECVGLVSGLNLGRDIGTHFAQESMLRSCCQLALSLELPLVLHISGGEEGGVAESLGRAVEIVREEGLTEEGKGARVKVILYDALPLLLACEHLISHISSRGIFCMVSAGGICDDSADTKAAAVSCLRSIPAELVLTCSHSPWKTPQNLSDVYLRTLRNEPGNISAVVSAVGSAWVEAGTMSSLNEAAAQLYANAKGVWAIDDKAQPPKSTTGNTSEADAESLTMDSLGISYAEPAADPVAERTSLSCGGGRDTPEGDGGEPAVPSVCYKCKGCRLHLFVQDRVRTHGADSVGRSSVFRVGEEGLCSTSVFLAPQGIGDVSDDSDEENDENDAPGYAVRGDVIYCMGCGNKLGKYCVVSATCGCGCVVPGPVLRFISDRVDLSVDTSDTSLMQMHAKIESENWEGEAGPNRPTKSKRKKKIKERPKHKGNYSVFRDKTFIKNASRKPKESSMSESEVQAEKAGESSDDSA